MRALLATTNAHKASELRALLGFEIDAQGETLSFEVDFFDCDSAHRACETMLYATGWDGDVLVTLHADGREAVRIRPEH